MNTTIVEDVARGAARLDELVPGWVDKIDLTRLDVASNSSCPLGQLFGSYGRGLEAISDEYCGVTHGFFPRMSGVDIYDTQKYVAACVSLTQAWRKLVVERRLVAVKV